MLPQPPISECPGFVASRPVWKRGDALPDQASNLGYLRCSRRGVAGCANHHFKASSQSAAALGPEALGEVAVRIVNLEETERGNWDSVGKDGEVQSAGPLGGGVFDPGDAAGDRIKAALGRKAGA